MKKKISYIVSIIAIAILVIYGLNYVAKIVERKDSVNKYAEFYEQEEDFDVLFLGQSRVLNAIFPMELWGEYGIVSYNLAGHGNRLPTNYWMLVSALEETSPRLVVLDCGLIQEESKIGSVEQLHLSLDHIPFGRTKLAMVDDLLGDSSQKWDFLWKFSTYHNRWNEVTKEDFSLQISPQKGAEQRIGVATPALHQDFGTTDKIEKETVGMEYLEKIIELCREKKIQLLLTYVPFPDPTGWQLESNKVWDIAKRHGLDYLDFHMLFDLIDISTDCYDADAHLNPSGGWKITSYLGSYITKRYGIEDRRKDPVYAGWHEDYAAYQQFKWKNLNEQQELKNYLMLLSDRELSFGIWMEAGASWYRDETMVKLLTGLGIDPQSYMDGNQFILMDRREGQRIQIPEGGSEATGMGSFGMRINFDTAAMIVDWEGREYAFDKNTDAAILTFDHKTGEIVDFAQFKVDSIKSGRIDVE